jgi:hypothetical protein
MTENRVSNSTFFPHVYAGFVDHYYRRKMAILAGFPPPMLLHFRATKPPLPQPLSQNERSKKSR